jgi:hypothetical protein
MLATEILASRFQCPFPVRGNGRLGTANRNCSDAGCHHSAGVPVKPEEAGTQTGVAIAGMSLPASVTMRRGAVLSLE